MCCQTGGNCKFFICINFRKLLARISTSHWILILLHQFKAPCLPLEGLQNYEWLPRKAFARKKQYNAIGQWKFPSKLFFMQPFREQREGEPSIRNNKPQLHYRNTSIHTIMLKNIRCLWSLHPEMVSCFSKPQLLMLNANRFSLMHSSHYRPYVLFVNLPLKLSFHPAVKSVQTDHGYMPNWNLMWTFLS